MYEREFSVPTRQDLQLFPEDRRPPRRRMRRQSRLPLAMLLLSLASFAMALAVGMPDAAGAAPSGPQAAGLSAGMSVRGEEPVLPRAEEPVPPPEEDWSLLLVNPWNPLPEDYDLTLTQLSNGHSVDQRCYPDLQEMMDDCRAAGLSPLICSSYRTQEKQEQLFQNKVDRLTAQGLSPEEARTEAAKSVAVPGTSEHQLGLAVDIVAADNQNLDQSQETTAVQRWLMEHCWEYGFILRYPEGKSDVTGIIYEPWHYRYVGREAAQAIRDQGVCLEEYLESLTA